MDFETTNPATGEVLHKYSFLNDHQVEDLLARSFRAWSILNSLSIQERVQKLKLVATSLRAHKEVLARLITLEMGKPISESLAEIEKSATAFDYYAEHGPGFLATDVLAGNYRDSQVRYQSLGPLFSVMPWNFPCWQVARFMAPALMIGNPILLKHSIMTAGFAQKMVEVVQQALTIQDAVLNLIVTHEQSEKIIADARVRAVTFTGSNRGGSQVAAAAGRAMKKAVLELGGSDAYLVLDDADVKLAAQICAKARLVNNGQSCVAAKRFIVARSVFAEFKDVFIETMISFNEGDPLSPQTKRGPLAAKKFQTELLQAVNTAEKVGAKALLKDPLREGNHAYFPLRVYQASGHERFFIEEEFFGPVAFLAQADSDEEAIKMANASIFGLGGAVFSKDLTRASQVADRMEAGLVAINDQVKSDPRLPFGGVKQSGHGRELSKAGILEFVNVKTVGIV